MEHATDLDELTDDAIEYILDNMDISRLSKWESGFVESVSDQWYRNHHLSDSQKLKLGEIWDGQD